MKSTSLDKTLIIIKTLSKHQANGNSLGELSSILGYPKSTIHHILKTLINYDYVEQDKESRKYKLGFVWVNVAQKVLDNINIRSRANVYLRELGEESGESVHLSILRDGKAVYIDSTRKLNPKGLTLPTYEGTSTEPHLCAGGKVLISELSEEEIRNMYGGGEKLEVHGRNSIDNITQLIAELKNVKERGYATDNEEFCEGVRCVAAPIRAGGKIIAAISIRGTIFTVTLDQLHGELKDMVTAKAKEISSLSN
jgi:IclR family transcriptional regulator, KDG regulon repressor